MAYTFLWRYTAVSWSERVRVFSLEVTPERVCWPCKWKREKKRECWKMSVFIENSCHGVGSKNAGRNWSGGCSFEHWPCGSPGQWVPETNCLRASAIFVTGTSGITTIQKYRSVSPIDEGYSGCNRNTAYILNCHRCSASEIWKVTMVAPSS